MYPVDRDPNRAAIDVQSPPTPSQETLSLGLKAAIAMFICGAATGVLWRELIALAIRILT